MRLRIIAGQCGGRLLDAPKNNRTHPMSERIRGAIFNKIQSKLPGARVLDAYAGTGALGLEALSRGAAHAMFLESDRIAQKIIRNNINDLSLKPSASVVATRVGAWLSTNDAQRFDVIFADPPYWDAKKQMSALCRLSTLLNDEGVLIISVPAEHDETQPLGDSVTLVDARTYAGAKILFYHKKV